MNKRDFGSFHSSNVQELLDLNDEDYCPPPLPFSGEDDSTHDLQSLQFGSRLKEKYFFIEADCTFVNHGAFGGVLRPVLSIAQKWQQYIERQPLRFYDRELLPHLVYVIRRLAKFVGCDRNDLVLVPNVTTAINCVVRNQKFESGDIIYCLSLRYGAVNKLLEYVCELTGAKIQEEKVPLPLSTKQQIVDLVKSTLLSGTKLAVFDHVPSNAAFILPIKEIIEVCHQRNVPVLIDGAHGLFALPLDLHDLGADYYVSNAHKWFCAPKGSAFMYVNKKWQTQTRSLIISHGFGSGFNSEFIWTGLRDYSPFLALHTVLDFWLSAGPDRIRSYMYSLIQQAAALLIEKWNSRLLAPVNMIGTMACVQLPSSLYAGCDQVTYSHGEAVQNYLFHKYNIEVPVKCFSGDLYVRISAHIYNELAEYEKLAQSVLQMKDNLSFIKHLSEMKS